ncbi:MAG: AAA family ATPase, partial [Chloroflexota bacterium]
MIKRITLRYFKRFENQTFEIGDSTILAGANNSGKTTLLQAIAVWHLALRKWLLEYQNNPNQAFALTRQDFTTIPLSEMNLLWTNRATDGRSSEDISPRILTISVEGDSNGYDIDSNDWSLAFEFTYHSPELIHFKPNIENGHPLRETLSNFFAVYVPFSGIGADGTRYDSTHQNLLIGQGRPRNILRNLLLQVSQDEADWQELTEHVAEEFGYYLF